MAFNKHKNMLKGISNVVEATSKEEQIPEANANSTTDIFQLQTFKIDSRKRLHNYFF